MANHPHDNKRPESAGVKKALEADDIDMLRDALTYRQRRFCEEYVLDFDGAKAAVRAGYAPKWPDRQAHMLMQNKGVVRYIDHLQVSKESKIASVTPEYVIQRAIALIDMAEQGKNVSAALRGLELLARHLGMFIERKEISGPDGGAIEIEQRQQQEAEEFRVLMDRLRDRQKKEVTLV